jgi:hypothetical protein
METNVIVSDRLIKYKLVQSFLKGFKEQELLTLDEYSRILKRVNILYKDVRG